MQHPEQNNFTKKTPSEQICRQIRKVEIVARKKNSMISSIAFLDADGNKLVDIQGANTNGERYTIDLGPNEYIVGCRQFNHQSLRDIEFRILDKIKLKGWNDLNGST